MAILKNPFRATRGEIALPASFPFPSADFGAVEALLAKCPRHAETQLLEVPALADKAGVEAVFIKDERGRMGLGSFKALGAAYVIAHEAVAGAGGGDPFDTLRGRTFVTASAGNHGMSVAAGARVFGAHAVIYLSEQVPDAFAARLKAKGAEVRVAGADYEASMQAAADSAEREGFTLLSDSSWEGYTELPWRLMEGYLAMSAEVARQITGPPSHILLQAGVGGMAGALAAHFRSVWGDEPIIAIVEPEAAPALKASIEAGKPIHADGPVSNMGRLDCKEPSLIALTGLARDADCFVTISDDEAQSAVSLLEGLDLASTPSGVAGIAALLNDNIRKGLGIGPASRVLTIMSEGPEAV